MARTGDLALARLHLDFDPRCRLVVRLFSVSPAHVANQASLGGALAGLARRGFRGG
jgi:cellulose synthase (UDP-forming)